MTEETPQITAPVVKSEKPKDPKRVEAGKRLAAISKAAKEKKALNRQHEKERLEKSDAWFSGSGIMALAALGALSLGSYALYGKYKDGKPQNHFEGKQKEEKSQNVEKEDVRKCKKINFD